MPPPFREMHHIGTATPERIVRTGCPAMVAHGLTLAGLTDAGRGYRMQRPDPPFGHVVICSAGEGRVWLDGDYVRCGAGQAYLSPPHQPHAFHTVGRRRWSFTWLYYRQAPGRSHLPATDHCQLVPVDAWPITTAVLGLYRESIGHAQPAMMDRWVELVQAAMHRLTASTSHAVSLAGLWEQVDARLAHRWTLAELADRSLMSREALRKLCQRQVGRSPLAQVTHLRMQRAAALLATTTQTVDAVGRAVGYPAAPAFCTAFKRATGMSPGAYRVSHGSTERIEA